MAPRIPLNSNTMMQEEIDAAKAVLDSGFVTMGKRCGEFEAAFAKYLGVRHAIMVNSGSSANLLAAFTMANPLCPLGGRRRIEPGSEVIVPALTWSTTVWPFVQAGAIPVFVDCDPHTLQMQPEAIQAAITPRTTAIAIVHVLGGAVDVPAIRKIADDNHLWLFEDTCESLGVLWDGKQVGSFGHLGSFSFYFAHHITTIEGGMVVTDDDDLADIMRALRAHGWVRHMHDSAKYVAENPEIDERFLFITTGFNLRPTEINGAIGLVQLTRLDGFNQQRRDVAKLLDKGLEALKTAGILKPMVFSERCTPAPFGYPVLCRSTEERNMLQSHLEANGIETRPVICGNLARQPALTHVDHRISGTLKGADAVMDRGLYWGTHPMMTPDDVSYIVDQVERCFR
ncbi:MULTISPECIES: DegT/DnrJ/EryC1/StrS family aminotransferase [unclassified Rhizobium]